MHLSFKEAEKIYCGCDIIVKNWREILVQPGATILATMAVIDRGSVQIALVANTHDQLLGTVCDGDVRRGILKGIAMSDSVMQIMNQNPVVAGPDASKEELRELMEKWEIRQIPVVDKERKIIRIETWLETMRHSPKDNPVVLMAGGVGRRLGELTERCPKPLLKVGDKPILQTILENFVECGFHSFYFSVNYRADMIQSYFGNGDKWGVEIQYLRENSPMGTAGALGLLPDKLVEPVIVMNGDILTKVNFENLLDFHKENRACATMCIRDYQNQIPYGVVEIEDHRLLAIHEKPIQQFFVSAGIYVFEPDIVDFLPTMGRVDMPELFHAVLQAKRETAVFPIREYWIDIGRIDDYEKAKGDYVGVFG